MSRRASGSSWSATAWPPPGSSRSWSARRRLTDRLARRPCSATSRVPAYNRILLSAPSSRAATAADALTLKQPEWYAAHGIDLRLGRRVLEIDRDAGEVMLVDGTRIRYDRLVLATGSIPTLPPIRGLVRMDGRLHPKVHAFRSARRLPTGWSSALPGARARGRGRRRAARAPGRPGADAPRRRDRGGRGHRAPARPARSARPAGGPRARPAPARHRGLHRAPARSG